MPLNQQQQIEQLVGAVQFLRLLLEGKESLRSEIESQLRQIEQQLSALTGEYLAQRSRHESVERSYKLDCQALSRDLAAAQKSEALAEINAKQASKVAREQRRRRILVERENRALRAEILAARAPFAPTGEVDDTQVCPSCGAPHMDLDSEGGCRCRCCNQRFRFAE